MGKVQISFEGFKREITKAANAGIHGAEAKSAQAVEAGLDALTSDEKKTEALRIANGIIEAVMAYFHAQEFAPLVERLLDPEIESGLEELELLFKGAFSHFFANKP